MARGGAIPPLWSVLLVAVACVPSGVAMSLLQTKNGTSLVLSQFSSFSNDTQPPCLLEPGSIMRSEVMECSKCMVILSDYSLLSCNNESIGDTWAYGCDATCSNCTSTIDVSPGDCTEASEIIGGERSLLFNSQLPEALYCSSSAPANSVFYVKTYLGEPPGDCKAELEPGTVEQVYMFDDVSGNCVANGFGEFYRMERGLGTDNETDFNGVLSCTDDACTVDCINVTSWIVGECNDPGSDRGTMVIGDCRVEPAGRPDRSNAVPMELLAVGILVLVLAGFFIAQACHRATKKKSGSAGSLNSDDREDSSLLATSLARDNTGRVSYAATAGGNSTTSIVRAEAAMKGGRQNDGKVAPIVASEQVAAAVRAEKLERERMSEIKAPVPLKMKTIKL